MSAQSRWEALSQVHQELAGWSGVRGVLTWDQQTGGMPRAAGPGRGDQLALLTRAVHRIVSDPAYVALLDELEATPTDDPVRRRSLVLGRRAWRELGAVPRELAERMARLQGDGFLAWLRAKREGDAAPFRALFPELVGTSREYAGFVDPARPPYDVLLDLHDPGTSAADVTALFARLRPGLRELLDAIAERPPLPELGGSVPLETQQAIARAVVAALGYDLDAGGIGRAEHPFMVRCGPADVRISTRFREADLLDGLSSATHEAGHAMYEQGMPAGLAPWGLQCAPSYGLHESQSRFWENAIARSLEFFQWLQGLLRQHLGDAAPDADRLYRAANRVERSLVRVEADEVTYNLHIGIRFEIERDLFSGSLRPDDVEAAWNAAYERDLGVTPPDPARGWLQDVHWSGGGFGYFPSYTLGNLYAAAFRVALERDLPDLWESVARGEFRPIREWLRARIHQRAGLLEAPALVREVCGDLDPVDALLGQLWARHGALHGCRR